MELIERAKVGEAGASTASCLHLALGPVFPAQFPSNPEPSSSQSILCGIGQFSSLKDTLFLKDVTTHHLSFPSQLHPPTLAILFETGHKWRSSTTQLSLLSPIPSTATRTKVECDGGGKRLVCFIHSNMSIKITRDKTLK